jgi:hypothetical protein
MTMKLPLSATKRKFDYPTAGLIKVFSNTPSRIKPEDDMDFIKEQLKLYKSKEIGLSEKIKLISFEEQ